MILCCLDAGAVSYVAKRENGGDDFSATLHTGAAVLHAGTQIAGVTSNQSG
jgi:hypothetical protein